MIITTKAQAFTVALTSLLVASCGKDKKETIYAAQTTAPQPFASPVVVQPSAAKDPAQEADKLAVEIVNFSEINSRSISNGTKIEFRLKNSQTPTSDIQFKCSLDSAASAGTTISTACTSLYTVQVQQDGQYTFTVYASQTSSSTIGNVATVNFSVGAGQPGVGQAGQVVKEQVGDLFLVTIPGGMHKVYSSSTFEQPGFIKFRMIDASMQDTAAPYPLVCHQGTSFEQLVSDPSPSGQALNYCEMTPPVIFNASADPIYNSFRSMNMSTLSYNSLAISSDGSLAPRTQGQSQPALAKMFINVFTNPGQIPSSQFQTPFTNELSQTASRLQISCGSQNIQYLGDAAINQGYYSWSVAVSPLFGCVNPRGGKWYVDIGAFPLEHVTSMLPSNGWGGWIQQSFASQRAAEIVVEIGPFDYAPTPMSVAQDAQAMMAQQIRKLTP
jgi:hypothetical protein